MDIKFTLPDVAYHKPNGLTNRNLPTRPRMVILHFFLWFTNLGGPLCY